jgi:hypothetical protein
MDWLRIKPLGGEAAAEGLTMTSLYQPATVMRVKDRIAQLKTDSERQWGRMAPAQALAHCSESMLWAVGDTHPPRMFVASILGRLIKSKVLAESEQMRKNSPTAKSLVIVDDCDLPTEQKRLCGLIDRFATAGPAGCTAHPHSFFGPLTPDEWAILMYKHLDHHLRQFGV